MNPELIMKIDRPYVVARTPDGAGAVVIGLHHRLTDVVKASEAHALAAALNQEHQNRMAQ